jgi:hypothetical protein
MVFIIFIILYKFLINMDKKIEIKVGDVIGEKSTTIKPPKEEVKKEEPFYNWHWILNGSYK